MGMSVVVRERNMHFPYRGAIAFDEITGVRIPTERMTPSECKQKLMYMREFDLEQFEDICVRETFEGLMKLLEHSVKTRCHLRVLL